MHFHDRIFKVISPKKAHSVEISSFQILCWFQAAWNNLYSLIGSACWNSNKTSSRWSISYITKGSRRLVNSDIQFRGSAMIHKKFKIYECFGRVTIVKTIHYRILECTRFEHVFLNIEFQSKHFEKLHWYHQCLNQS